MWTLRQLVPRWSACHTDRFNYSEMVQLPTAALRRHREDAVSSLIDGERWNRQVAVHQLELSAWRSSRSDSVKLPQITATFAREINDTEEGHFRAT